MRALLILGVSLALAGAAHAQQMYRWVDKGGKVHYTQQPPPPEARNVQRKALAGSVVETGVAPYATQVAATNFPVTLFAAASCGPACKEARESLEKRGIPFKEVTVGDEKSIEALKRVSGKAQVPALQVGAQVVVGFEPESWKAALDAAGYPASAPPLRPRRAESSPAPAPKSPAGEPPEVKLYTSPDCGAPCQEAKSLLAGRKVAFREIDVANPATFAELTKVSGGATVPVLVVGQSIHRGFDSVQYQSMLDAAGIPLSAPAPAAARR